MGVVIVGAGIGGLAAALSLHAVGIRSTVLESTAEIKALGVGINVLPHAVKELDDLGLLPTLEAAAVKTQRLAYVTKRGHEIWSEPRGLAAGYRWPQLSIHRGTLQMILLEAVRARLGPDAVRCGARAVGAVTDANRANVSLVDSTTGAALPPAFADVAIAADGIHSAIRASYNPGEGKPRWGGMVLWRGTTVRAPVMDGATMIIAGNRDQKFVLYPICDLPDGRQLINWIVDLKVAESTITSINDWNRVGDKDHFLPRYRDWTIPGVDIAAIVEAAERIYEYPMSDRDPLATWVHGRVALLGDAAHAMYPIGSNGASQAILDGRRLAFELATRSSIPDALAAYDANRRPPMERLLHAHRAEGADVILDLLEDRAPQGYADIETVLPMREREEIALKYKRMAGFDIDSINAAPPLRPAA